MIRALLTHALPIVAIAAFAAGCNNEAATTDAPESPAAHEEHGAEGGHAAHGEEGHDHPTTGPHEGGLIELGDHEYLAELVHDDASVTIYLYEHDGTTPVPVEAKEITISLLHDGQPEQFPLAASPEAGDPAGKSSRFTLENEDLAGHIDDEASKPQLMVTVNGTPYSAPVAHDHDHAGHDHDGHDHEH